MMKNEYLSYLAIVEDVSRETFDTNTYRVKFKDEKLNDSFQYKQGQFMQISLPGIGEAPFSISSSPSRKGFLEFSIRAVGRVTKGIFNLKKGDIIYLRGPYGNSFPFEEVKKRNLFFIAGGIGLVPLRSLINLVFDNRNDFADVTILYGAKTPNELCFKNELKVWEQIHNTKVFLTVDNPDGDWRGNVGVVTTLWDKESINGKGGVAFVCGPPVMIRFVIIKLLELGFKDKDIYITLERYMKCGIGKCGHCNIGTKFVCVDGPVFSYHEIKEFPGKERAI